MQACGDMDSPVIHETSRLRFLGIRAAGAEIALFGGLMAAFDSAASGFVLWTLSQPGIAQNGVITQTLNLLYGLAQHELEPEELERRQDDYEVIVTIKATRTR